MGIYDLDGSSVITRLQHWGRWKMSSGVSLGYPNQSAFMHLAISSTPHDRFGEIDSDCIETDKAVDLLPFVKQIIIRVEYVLPYSSVATKANHCGISKRSYYNYLVDAHEMVAQLINNNRRKINEPVAV